MTKPTLKERLVYKAIEVLNDIVENLEPDEAHDAINLIRRHLRARSDQTAPLEPEPEKMRRRTR